MIKKTITFEDFNGEEQTEDFYFNLTSAELIEMEVESGFEGGLGEYLKSLTTAANGQEIMKMFKEILGRAYGVRTDDGRRFQKSPDLSEEFFQSAAYDALFMDLISDQKKAVEFVNGLLPKKIQQVIQNGQGSPTALQPNDPIQAQNKAAIERNTETPPEPTSPLTQEELIGMSQAEFAHFQTLHNDTAREAWIREFRVSRKGG